MSDKPTTSELRLVARHGSGPLERALATVQLARREGREAELRELLGEPETAANADEATPANSEANPKSDLQMDGGTAAGWETPGEPVRPQPGTNEPEVVNVVASGSVGRELDILAIGTAIDDWEADQGGDGYKPDVVYLRRRERGPMITVYRTGSYHITGARSVAEAETTLRWFCDEFDRLLVGRLDVTFEVQNVVGIGDLGRTLDLRALWSRIGHEQAEYDPAVDSALMYRPETVDVDFRIHSSGSVQLYGDTLAAVYRAFDWLRSEI